MTAPVVAGIGLGWGDWDMASGALLLLSTNLVGIALAYAIGSVEPAGMHAVAH